MNHFQPQQYLNDSRDSIAYHLFTSIYLNANFKLLASLYLNLILNQE